MRCFGAEKTYTGTLAQGCSAAQFVKETPRCALFVSLRLGKTVISLTAIADLFMTCDVSKVLVIAPLRVAKLVWPPEIDAWPHLRHLRVAQLLGSPKEREAALATDADIYVINREQVPWLCKRFPKDTWPFDAVVIDESSSFKSPRAERFKRLKRVIPHSDRVIELTATPTSNGLLDLWSQIYLLDGGDRLCRTFTDFKRRWFDENRSTHQVRPLPGSAEEIHAKVADLTLRMGAEDYLELPDLLVRDIAVELRPAARKQYRELEREFLIAMDEDTNVVAGSAAVLANKLQQMCQGAVYDEEKTVHEIHEAKLDALDDLIEEAGGESMLVAYHYQHDAQRIRSRHPAAVDVKEPDAIERWNRGDVPLLLAHPASAGHGLNLQSGGHRIVWFALPWSLELYEQFNGRLHRQGQEKPVIAHRLVVEDSIDETVLEALAGKGRTQRELLEAVAREAERRET